MVIVLNYCSKEEYLQILDECPFDNWYTAFVVSGKVESL